MEEKETKPHYDNSNRNVKAGMALRVAIKNYEQLLARKISHNFVAPGSPSLLANILIQAFTTWILARGEVNLGFCCGRSFTASTVSLALLCRHSAATWIARFLQLQCKKRTNATPEQHTRDYKRGQELRQTLDSAVSQCEPFTTAEQIYTKSIGEGHQEMPQYTQLEVKLRIGCRIPAYLKPRCVDQVISGTSALRLNLNPFVPILH